MDNNNQNMAPNMGPNMNPTPVVPAKSSNTGMILTVIIILALLVIGALYFWNNRTVPATTSPDNTLQSINTQSGSDEAASIQADLNATNVNSADASLNQ